MNCVRRDGLIEVRRRYERPKWLVVSGPARKVPSNAAYARVSAAKAFPKSLLYPTIAGSVWSALFRGDP